MANWALQKGLAELLHRLDGMLFCIRELRVQSSFRRPALLTEVIFVFLTLFGQIPGYLIKLCRTHFLPHPYQIVLVFDALWSGWLTALLRCSKSTQTRIVLHVLRYFCWKLEIVTEYYSSALHCNLLYKYHRFTGTCCLHFQGKEWLRHLSVILQNTFCIEVRFCLATMNGTLILESRLDYPLFAISLMSVTLIFIYFILASIPLKCVLNGLRINLCLGTLKARVGVALYFHVFLTFILRRSRTGTVWFYTSTSNREQHDQNCTQSH